MPDRYFDPEGLARVGNMELVARQVVEGFLTGRHRSPYHGFSVEYLDHRPYTPGDELRNLDWKILARTDKYFIKLFEDETNLRAHILLDCSRSMGFTSGRLTKLEYGGYLTAALAHLMLRQNDAVGLTLFDRSVRLFLPPVARPTQFRRILQELETVTPREETDLGSILHEVAERIRRRGLVILISDLIDDPARIASGLQHFRHNHHEVVVFHVLDDAELTFPFDRMTRFKDMEGAAQVAVNPPALRKQYLERLKAFTDRLEADCFDRQIGYTLANTRQPYDLLLAEYLEKRSRLG
jgi:uncharacterized protein (DUF58 family)